MSTTNLATWIAHMEHQEKARTQARNEQLLDDILVDDFEVRQAFNSANAQSTSKRAAAWRYWLTSLSDMIGRKSELVLEPPVTEECLGCSD